MDDAEPRLLAAIGRSLWLLARGADGWSFERLATLGSRVRCVATDPGTEGRIFIGSTDDGLWRSDDRGRTFVRVGEGLLDPRVMAVAVSPVSWGSSVVYAGTQPSALYRSGDGGEGWEDCESLLALPSAPTWSFPPRPETNHVRWIELDPLVPDRLFVAIEAGALVSSNDGGVNWIDRRPGGPYDTHQMTMHPQTRDHLYSAAGDGFFESRDGGVSWAREVEGLEHRYAWSVVVDPEDPESLIISTASSARAAHRAERAESWIYRRTTAGAPWHLVREGLPEASGTTISALAIDPVEPRVVYAANNRGIHRSDDWGERWERLDLEWPESLGGERVAGLAPARWRAPGPGTR